MGIKTNGDRCQRPENGFINLNATHLHYCGTHWDVYGRHVERRAELTVVVAEQNHRAGTCHHWIIQRWCGRLCEGNALLCAGHAANAGGRVARRQAEQELQRIEAERINIVTEWYRANPMTWRQVMDHVFTIHRDDTRALKWTVSRMFFLNPGIVEPDFANDWQFQIYWTWCIGGRLAPVPNLAERPVLLGPPPRNDLAAIATDRQNVHTAAVSQQTNKGLEKLLEEAKTAGTLRAPEWFAARWLLRSYGSWDRVSQIVNDMMRWYNTRSCRTANDWLYQKTLDGLYSTIRKIKDTDTKQELYQRVFEECFESVGMCCDGHISRLCNVLVGFDETFAPPVPFGEVLQNKMAAIAALDVETEEKIRQATAFFTEFAVPESERSAWLEAF